MAELASAYITLIPTLKGASKSIQGALGGSTSVSAGQSFGGGFLGGFKPSLGQITGLISGIVGSAAVAGGISRAMKLEQAEFKFKAMGLNVEKAMESCNAAVKGTAFGLDAAASIAAMLGTSGVKAGDQMTNSLKAAAGMAAMGGVELERVGAVFSKVAATGRLQGDELMQFTEMGINATSALSKHLGKSQSEVREMISKGEVDFQTFADAMYATFGDAAQGANDTFSGALSNIGSAVSRLTAKFAAPGLDALKNVFKALIPAIDAVSANIDPLVKKFETFASWASENAVAAIEAFTKALEDTGSIPEAVAAAFGGLSGKAKAVIGAIAGIGGAFAAMKGISTVKTLAETVTGLGGKMKDLPVLGGYVGRFMDGFKDANVAASSFSGLEGTLGGKVSSLVAKFKGFGSITGFITSPIGIAVGVIAALAAAFVYLWNTSDTFQAQMKGIGATLMSTLMPALKSIGNSLASLAQAVIPVVVQLIQTIVPILAAIASAVMNVAAVVLPVVAQIVAAVLPVIAQIISAVVQVASQVITAVLPVITMILSAIQTAMPVIKAAITSAMNVVLAIVNAVWPVVQAVITAAMNVIQSVIKIVTSAIRGDWSGVWNGIKSLFSSVWNGIKSVGKAALNSLKSIVSSGISKVTSVFKSLPGTIKGMFSGAASWLVNSGEAIIDGLTQGIRNAFSSAKEALRNGLQALRNLLPFSPAKEGPFSGKGWTLYSGMSMMEALGQGISRSGGTAVSAMSGVLSDVSSAATADLEPFGNVSDASGAVAGGGPAAASGGTVYNVYFNNNKVNDDEEITAVFNELLRVMKRKGAMGNVYA